jgi:hypothetical protein
MGEECDDRSAVQRAYTQIFECGDGEIVQDTFAVNEKAL